MKHVMLAGLTWLKHWLWVFVTEPKGKICPFCHYKHINVFIYLVTCICVNQPEAALPRSGVIG